MKMDICIPVKHELLTIFIEYTLPSILNNIDFKNVYVIMKKGEKSIRATGDPRIKYLNEDQLYDGLTFSAVNDHLKSLGGNESRTGWYFQQFLKLALSYRPEISENFLIWDADSVLIRPIKFIDEFKRPLINPSSEYHKPYFETINRILKIDRKVNYSFISEHMVFNKTNVKCLIAELDINGPNSIWWKTILNNINSQHISQSGFSEYETYGNYVQSKIRDYFVIRKLRYLRSARKYFKAKPSKIELFILKSFFDYYSLELSHDKIDNPVIRYIELISKIIRANLFKS